MKLKGIGASSGIAVAKIFELKEIKLKILDSKVANKDKTILKVKAAIKEAVNQIKEIKDKAKQTLSNEEVAIFDAHINLAQDPLLIDTILQKINDDAKNELVATNEAIDFFANMFATMDDEYMQERASDVKDVGKRILNILSGVKNRDLSTINEEVIIVANDLTPSETATLNKKYVKGFLTNIGGKTSHAAIMARSLEIPAVLGLKDITEKINANDVVAIDGDTGEVLINPSKIEEKEIKKKAKAFKANKLENLKFKGKKSLSKDGIQVEIVANIGSPKDVANVIENDAEGVGLFRSEFLYMDSKNWPNEEEQFKSYKEVLEGMNDKKVIVRTLDIGGDKKLSYYKFPKEMNPFLGYRAIRFCLDQKKVFKTQLRALLRASVYGKLSIMFPMIATIKEFLDAKAILNQCKKELIKANQKVASDIEIGMMVEIPAAAIIADQFAKYVDFFSIGTNDLMQYTMAADRMSQKVSYLYQPLNPAILNMINMTIKGAHKNGKWVGMCGEMAGDVNAIPILLGLGLDEFSMSSTSILEARKLISKINKNEAHEIANKALTLESEKDVQKLVHKFLSKSTIS